MSDENGIQVATGKLGRVVVMRFPPDTEILTAIEDIAIKEGIRSGIIVGGAASLTVATLRNVRTYPDEFPITDDVRIFSRHDGPLELLSISGNISEIDDSNLRVHCHGVISVGTPDAVAYGGHLVPDLKVFSTAELAIAEVEGVHMGRVFNDQTQTLELHPEETDTEV